MKEVTTKQQIWNSAAKDGAILACITIGAGLINILMNKITGNSTSPGTTMIAATVSMLLWIIKTVGSFLLLKRQVTVFSNANGDPGKRFGYGVKVALFSSILCAVFVAVDLLYISADTLSGTWDMVMQMYSGQLDSNSTRMLENIKEYIPVYSTIGQFIWMFIIGIVFSAIISSMRKSTPFGQDGNTDGQYN